MIRACLTCEELECVWLVKNWSVFDLWGSDRDVGQNTMIRVCLTCEKSGCVWLVKNQGVFDLWRIGACLTCGEVTGMFNSTQWSRHVKKWQLCWTVHNDWGMFDLWRSDSYVGHYPVIMACLTWWQCHRTERTTSCVPTWASGYPGSMSAMETVIVPTTPMKLTAILVSVWENWTFTLTDIFHWHPMLPPIVSLLQFCSFAVQMHSTTSLLHKRWFTSPVSGSLNLSIFCKTAGLVNMMEWIPAQDLPPKSFGKLNISVPFSLSALFSPF